jgi:hypothetical protein
MTPELHARAKEIFLAASRHSIEQRSGYLDQACAADAELRAAVEQLLRHHLPTASGESTVTAGASRAAPQSLEDGGAPSSDPVSDDYAFEPGTIVAERYRIVSKLGRGGMGEVFRCDDFVLARPVALKFLQRRLSQDTAWLKRLLHEAHVAQGITHPIICRVFDVHTDERIGTAFISMEYVEGEDLRSLLRRIGRLPAEKALEVSRQLCIGLTAAHARGVLHRDLKPANIMLDSHGDVRIMDFGLATPLAGAEFDGIAAGTPGYMAPELFVGTAPSVRSDLYALGVVMYETFSGQPLIDPERLSALTRLPLRVQPRSLSEIVPHCDPAVQNIIEHCLESDPARRPASALDVVAALPGSDAMVAALAAGVTPAPAVVASSGRRMGLSWAAAGGLLAAFVALLSVVALLIRPSGIAPALDQAQPAVLLHDLARRLAAELNYGRPSDHTAGGFSYRPSEAFFSGLTDERASRVPRLVGNEYGDFYYWYRQSPNPLTPDSALNLTFGAARPGLADPPQDRANMLKMVFDSRGRLVAFAAVAPRAADIAQPLPKPDWSVLFRAAGLTAAELTPSAPIEPERPDEFLADERFAWTGNSAAGGAAPLRVEAATRAGRPVYFALVQAPANPAEAWWFDDTWRLSVGIHTRVIALALVALIAVPLAWRNIRFGRSDRRGGLRLATFVFLIRMLIWTLIASHVSRLDAEFILFLFAALGALLEAALAALFYVALEPYVRRFWPQTIITWARVLNGRLRDPLVGRDLLIGALIGVVAALLVELDRLLVGWLGLALRAPLRFADTLLPLLGGRPALASILGAALIATYLGLFIVIILVLSRNVVRRTWLAAAMTIVITAPMYLPQSANPFVSWLPLGLLLALEVWAAVRFGLWVVICANFVGRVLITLPVAFPPSAGTPDATLFPLLIVVGLAAIGAILACRPPRERPSPAFS